MKKTILKAMMFFAFLTVGLQSVSAQQYVTSDDATILLATEIQEATDLAANVTAATKASQGPYLDKKVQLFTYVKGQIAAGSSVEASVKQGADRFNHTVNSFSIGMTSGKDPYVSPLHQELIDLLTL